MLTDQEIADGTSQLNTDKKLKPRDVRTLHSVFLIYLKDRAAAFSDLKTRLETVTDTNSEDDQPASELAALAILFRDNGFSLANLKGGRNALETDKQGEFVFKIQYGLTLLGYVLPEYFSGGIENDTGSGGGSYCSYTPPKTEDCCGFGG